MLVLAYRVRAKIASSASEALLRRIIVVSGTGAAAIGETNYSLVHLAKAAKLINHAGER
jgi:hypothetical protein